MKAAKRLFNITTIEAKTIVETGTRKDILSTMDQYIENMQYDFFDTTDDSFAILYKDGSTDYIDQCYDGHKIKRQNILSMVYTNPESDIIYGNFEMNECGVVIPSAEEVIAEGIEEIV